MIKTKILSLFILAVTIGSCKKDDDYSYTPPYIPETSTIWQQTTYTPLPTYAAYTDLTRFGNAFYCIFREGPNNNVGTPIANRGKARIIKSADGLTWTSVALFDIATKDIKDPKLSITPDNRLMVSMSVEGYATGGASINSRTPYVSFSDNAGSNFSTPEEASLPVDIKAASNLIWRITWHKGVGYGIDHFSSGGPTLIKTTDGKNFTKVAQLTVDGSPSEATIRFDQNDKMYVLIRRDGLDQNGILITSVSPYSTFQQTKVPIRLAGANFIFLDNNTLCISTRAFSEGTVTGTSVFTTDLNGNILKSIKLPSAGGDTGYPGMVVHDNKLWVSYYSTHYVTEASVSRIYLSKIPLTDLR